MSCGEHQSKTNSQLSVKGSIEIVSAQLDHLRMSCVETSIDDNSGVECKSEADEALDSQLRHLSASYNHHRVLSLYSIFRGDD